MDQLFSPYSQLHSIILTYCQISRKIVFKLLHLDLTVDLLIAKDNSQEIVTGSQTENNYSEFPLLSILFILATEREEKKHRC